MAFPFDRSYKLMAEEDPRGAITVVAGVPLPPEAEIETLDRELNLAQQRVDHIYKVSLASESWLLHFEALTHYSADWRIAQLDHAAGAVRKYRLPIYSHLLLFRQRGTPNAIDTEVVLRSGDLTQILNVNIVRLWERPAAEVLASGSVALYPWAALMDATTEEQREAARRLRDSGREGLQMQMALLGALRYGSRRDFLERIGPMLLTKEILRESPLWQEIETEARSEGLAKGLTEGLAKGLTEGLAKGLSEGRVEGRAEGERRALTLILTRRFGQLPEWAESRIAAGSLDTLERWITQAVLADSLENTLSE